MGRHTIRGCGAPIFAQRGSERKRRGGDKDRLRERNGLPVASYFTVRWLLDDVPMLTSDLSDPNERDYVRFGTVDTWMAYKLTGSDGVYGAGIDVTEVNAGNDFVTDVTNASWWLFLGVRTL